jgi:predicted transposase/invertase (TIGR01784 family)
MNYYNYYNKIIMARYLDPKADLTFKRIFADHPALLISFLNAVMPFEPDRHIVDLQYLPAEMVPDNPGKKDSIVDVRCIDNYKRQFIVEIQTDWFQDFMNRIVFNAGKAYIKQLDAGKNYQLLQPVYTLAILSSNFDHLTTSFYHHFQIINRANSNEIIPGLEFILVELTEKFRPETVADRKLMVLWLRFLKEVNVNMRSLPAEMAENEYIRQAAELCEVGAFTPEELAGYDRFWDMVSIEKTKLCEAREEGRAEGHATGVEESEVIGEKKKAITVARKAIRKGLSVQDASELSGLSEEEVNDLMNRL